MDGEGFEPSKSLTTDLQSAPFGRSGIHPEFLNIIQYLKIKADERTRTPDLLITNQLLYQLSYIGVMGPTGLEPVTPCL